MIKVTDAEKDKEREKGLQKGKIEIAKIMLKHDESIEKIIKYTGLSKEDIENF